MTVDPVAQPVAQPRVHMDLDHLERTDSAAGREPFGFNHCGKVIQLTDPREMDYQVVAYAQNNPITLLNEAISVEDHKFLAKNPIPLWKMEIAAEKYMKHYDLGDAEGNDA